MKQELPVWVEYAGDVFYAALFLIVYFFFKPNENEIENNNEDDNNQNNKSNETIGPNELEKILVTEPEISKEPANNGRQTANAHGKQ